jgi:hypothetical protein
MSDDSIVISISAAEAKEAEPPALSCHKGSGIMLAHPEAQFWAIPHRLREGSISDEHYIGTPTWPSPPLRKRAGPVE